MDSELVQFKNDVEHLQICKAFMKDSSIPKVKISILQLDHFAEVLMFRLIKDKFKDDDFTRFVIPQKYSVKFRLNVLKYFDKKIDFLSKEKELSRADASILKITHFYRNAAHHRDVHNSATLPVLAKCLFSIVCKIFCTQNCGCSVGGSSVENEIGWLREYGWAKNHIDFGEVKALIRKSMMSGMIVRFSNLKSVLINDLYSRKDEIGHILEKELPRLSDTNMNEILKNYEFWGQNILNPEIFDDLSKEYREIIYRIQTPKKPSKREYLGAEGNYKKKLSNELKKYSATVTVHKIKEMEKYPERISGIGTMSNLLVEYEKVDKYFQLVERCLEKAVADWDRYIQMQVDIARGK